jgi:outer membrane protein assembly factor BamD
MPASAPTRARTAALACALTALVASACGSSKQVAKPADELYDTGKQYQQEEYHDAAIEQYKQLLDHYPLDPRAEEVELAIAQAHYANEAYPEAIAAFSDFQRMHPTSPKQAEVEYTIGQAYGHQMDTIDRDLAAGMNASLRYESVIARFPRSEYADKAREKLRETREHLAARELYIAEFYYRRGKTRAARGRVIELVARYPETDAAREGLQRLADDARSYDDAQLAGLAEAALQERTAIADADAAARAADPGSGSGGAGGSSGGGSSLASAPSPPPSASGAAPSRPAPAKIAANSATANLLRTLRERQNLPDLAAVPKEDGGTP